MGLNEQFFAALAKVVPQNQANCKQEYIRGWYEGGLAGMRTGAKDERQRILSAFEYLSEKPLSKQDFAKYFVEFVNNREI